MGALILGYHRVGPVDDPLRISVSPENFTAQMEVLADRSCPMTLSELGLALAAGVAPTRAVAITFDDGYVDNLRTAKPVLAAHGLPATVFVITGAIGTQAFWWDRLVALARASGSHPSLSLTAAGHRRTFTLAPEEGWLDRMWRMWGWLRLMAAEEVTSALDELHRSLGSDAPPELDGCRRPMTAAELEELASDGLVQVGAHTITHPVLAASPAERQRAEIAGSRAELERRVQRPVTSFAYPYGVRGRDYSALTTGLVAELGFSLAVAGTPASDPRDRFDLPRESVGDLSAGEFADWLEVTSRDGADSGARAPLVARADP